MGPGMCLVGSRLQQPRTSPAAAAAAARPPSTTNAPGLGCRPSRASTSRGPSSYRAPNREEQPGPPWRGGTHGAWGRRAAGVLTPSRSSTAGARCGRQACTPEPWAGAAPCRPAHLQPQDDGHARALVVGCGAALRACHTCRLVVHEKEAAALGVDLQEAALGGVEGRGLAGRVGAAQRGGACRTQPCCRRRSRQQQWQQPEVAPHHER